MGAIGQGFDFQTESLIRCGRLIGTSFTPGEKLGSTCRMDRAPWNRRFTMRKVRVRCWFPAQLGILRSRSIFLRLLVFLLFAQGFSIRSRSRRRRTRRIAGGVLSQRTPGRPRELWHGHTQAVLLTS